MNGTPFGRYRLVELLGRGGMGEVWRAYDTATNNRTVAIKLLPPHLAEDRTFAQRFRREADAAARLNNPHIIPIHNYGEIDGRLYVDMRLIEGRDLQEVLADGPMAPARAVHIIEQVAKALHAAHKIGLIHRDVKPSNILLDEDDFAYLIDFGIARAVDDTRMTGTGGIIGSWPYMSPERLQAGQIDARSDIYALTCVLYECLTGSTPYPGYSLEQQITAHLTAPPPRPSSINNLNVPVEFDAVIATGMAKNSAHRYPSATEMASAARAALTTATPSIPGSRGAMMVGPEGGVWASDVTRQRSPSDTSLPAGHASGAAQNATRRPGAVTAAAVFAAFSALGQTAMGILNVVVALANGSLFGSPISGYGYAVVNFAAAVFLLWGGVAALRGRTNKILVYTALALAAVMIAQTVLMVRYSGSPGAQSPAATALGAVVPILVIAALTTARSREFFAARGGTIAKRQPLFVTGAVLAVVSVAVATTVSLTIKPGESSQVPAAPRERGIVMLVIDVSQSMRATDVSPSRFEAMKTAAIRFTEQLNPRLNLGVISYAGTATMLVAPTTDHDAAKSAIGGIQLADRTATGEAIFTGLQAIATSGSVIGGVGPPPAWIVLLSDGKETVPLNPDNPKGAYTAARTAKEQGVPISTISLGTPDGYVEIDNQRQPTPVDDSMLREIANLAGGQFYSASTTEGLNAAFDAVVKKIG